MIFTIIIFLIVLSVLVFVHELGHFIVAKRSGMKVHEFGFGFPPRVFGIQKVNGHWKIVWGHRDTQTDDTVYSINWIPLGGFVKIMGEDNDSEGDDRSFVNKPFWRRLATLLAGVVMNFLLAGVLLGIGYMAGFPLAIQSLSDVPHNATFTDRHVAIIEVVDGSPAQKSGLESNDIIQKVNGQTFSTVEDLQNYTKSHKGEAITFDIKRINEYKSIVVNSDANPGEGKGAVGIGMVLYGKMKFSPIIAIGQGFITAYGQIIDIAKGLYHLFASGAGLKSLGGPIEIAKLTGQEANLGIINLVQFTAFLSLNLALLNALPIPALDGGRVLFLIIEKIRGKRNNPKIEQYANAIGFLLLLLLMVVVSIHDASKTEFIKHLFS